MTARREADWVLVERAAAGRATKAEVAELGLDQLQHVVERLSRRGWSAAEIAQQLHIPERRVTRLRSRATRQKARTTG
ncbi:hypothetical protein Lesp02_84240 [Lentzea sp. NBRC 105346]|uniref:helix-turn-helix domain-containing protein n=1 Tax=Lentzea sp. NBRC 105346 TaxID=3032205 RepID=UPI0024A4E661|nr:helix-turn-helix domain-containing protein [Lentzea sp. NBRC 105346]GLZ36237.1 hypothetical protein Lesp02_84240 [Lentzea sp. NBRC 105346]